MNRRHFLLSALVAATVSPRGLAQVAPTVKGSREDLRGAKSVFVDTSYDHALRDAVVAELKAQLPELAIREEPDGADLVVRCSRGLSDDRNGHDDVTKPPFDAGESTSSPAARDVPRTRRLQDPYNPEIRRSGDDEDEDAMDEPKRFLVGSVLRPVTGGPAREAISFRQPVRTQAESAVRDFVRKLAKELKKANHE